MNRDETILQMAKAIQQIEHGGYHTALRQAEACFEIVERGDDDDTKA